jgi:hypothetical protein
MSKVESPLYGTEATGPLFGLIGFSNQWGTAIVRSLPPPGAPPSAIQAYRRSQFKEAVSVWRTLPTSEKISWSARKTDTLTGYNVFIKAYLSALTQDEIPIFRALYGTFKANKTLYGTNV